MVDCGMAPYRQSYLDNLQRVEAETLFVAAETMGTGGEEFEFTWTVVERVQLRSTD